MQEGLTNKFHRIVQVMVFPINVVLLITEVVIQIRKPSWEVSPFNLSFYFILLTFMSTNLLFSDSNVWNILGVYIMTQMLIESLWKMTCILIGRRAIIYPNFKIMGRSLNRKSEERRLITPTAFYMGIVSFGFTIYYFGFIHFCLYRLAPSSYSVAGKINNDASLFWRFIYHSATTITTRGGSLIEPISFSSQLIEITEVAFGIFFIVFMFGIFISHYVSNSQNDNKL